ncbi:MAG: hypothetical protein F2555_06015 [Actinobacteria bacterium]|uniref:Unannotated protein n=1 Tax=freshwater metagenome TaxID=449393 RepID=A0A6J6EPN2_9ZZZZ|nr:hypothetical protein [Actinomycetota bacterium]
MASERRNRSEGWRHAKLDGHANEEQFAASLINDQEFISAIEKQKIKISPEGSPEVSVDGTKHVESIFGDMTTSKVDLALNWSDGQQVNISLKKSEAGQVWLVSVPRFISAIEFHSKQKIDLNARIGISLFIGGTKLSDYEEYFTKALDVSKKKNPRIAVQELHQSRLVAKSIEENFPLIWKSTLDFFNSNIGLITRLSFAQGLAKSEKDAADVIIYNKVVDGKSIFPISKIIEDATSHTKTHPTTPGPKNGGSTLQLPTGFLQMHHPQEENLLQFHHQYKKISKL